MDSTKNFQEISYKIHEKFNNLKDGELSEMQKSWFRDDTVDFWRHDRMYSPLTPLLKEFPNSKWVTVGDGRFGMDSIKLKRIESSLKILPTDISTSSLEHAKQNGMIEDYARQNAEKMEFADNEFDFAFCKESYHHFPRPYIALYEMIRVAKKAVILIEPNEPNDFPWMGQMILNAKKGVKKFLNKKNYHTYHWHFEEVGNYIYSVSKRELQKIALGLNLPAIAVYYFNDYYEHGVEYEKADEKSKLFNKVKGAIANFDKRSKLGLSHYTDIIGIVFKEKPSEKLAAALKEVGFEIDYLPENPYLKNIG